MSGLVKVPIDRNSQVFVYSQEGKREMEIVKLFRKAGYDALSLRTRMPEVSVHYQRRNGNQSSCTERFRGTVEEVFDHFFTVFPSSSPH